MDICKTHSLMDGSETSRDPAQTEVAPAAANGLPRAVSEALADPIVMALMAADRVERQAIEDLLRRIAAGLAQPDRQGGSARSARRQEPADGAGLGKLAKGAVLALATVAGLSGLPPSAAADDVPVAFIGTLGAQALSMSRSPTPLVEKVAYFERLVRQDFDLPGVCRLVLGPYWRFSSPADRQQFCDGFADRLVRFYGQPLAQSGDGGQVKMLAASHR